MPHKISICNYEFQASNGKKTVLDFKVERGCLVGESVADILQDKTGMNKMTMFRRLLKENKTKKGLKLYGLKMTKVEIITHAPKPPKHEAPALIDRHTTW